jgi:hypothetical protein
MREHLFKVAQAIRYFKEVRPFEEGLRDARAAQEAKLLEIVRANENTVYGREHGFQRVRSIEGFQASAPVQSYDDLEPYVQRAALGEPGVLTQEAPLMFALTSGTTGASKLIPVTPSYLSEYNHAVQVHTWGIFEDYPEVGKGKFLVPCGADLEGYTEGGLPFGSISGFLTKRQPAVVRQFFALPYEVGLIKDVEAKYYAMLLLALQEDIRLAVSVNPSSLVLLAEKLQLHAESLVRDIRDGTVSRVVALPEPAAAAVASRLRRDPERAWELDELLERHGELRPRDVWPNLALLSCWKGGTVSLYLPQLEPAWGSVPVRDLGYMASEGRGSIPLTDEGAAGVLPVTTHFFEFVPVETMESGEPVCLTADQVRPGEEYYILFTTSAGLYRYHVNDVVRVAGFHGQAPLIEFVRKGQGISSITGEKLVEPQVTASLQRALEEAPLPIKHFSAAPRWARPPYYALMAELDGTASPQQKTAFVRAIDRALSDANLEYRAKRESQRLGGPVLCVLAPGTIERYRQARVLAGAGEAQVKVPHLSPDLEFGSGFEVLERVPLTPERGTRLHAGARQRTAA